MLAGTVYFYNEAGEVVKELDLEAYEDLTEEAFKNMIEEISAQKVVLRSFSHNHHDGVEGILYQKHTAANTQT